MKVITYDIEVSPRIGYFYGSNWEPKLVKEIEGQKLLSFAWKELGKKKTHIIANQPVKVMLKEIRSVLDDADICIGHNLNRFDRRMMNSFFVTHGFTPPSPAHVIDTLTIARRQFAFPSNKLNDLALYLGLKPKLDSSFDIWEGCMNNDPKAWKKMIAYNKHDVVLTEELYLILRPWDTNGAAIVTEHGCTTCGGERLIKRGTRTNKGGTLLYHRYQCKDCGAWKQDRLGVKTEVTTKS